MESTRMLNEWKDGRFKARHTLLYNLKAHGITSQNNCMDCHGQNVPSVEDYKTLDK
jgi:hypothetical protein